MNKRGFEKISPNEFTKLSFIEVNYDDIIIPNRSTAFSAGYDFYSIMKVTLNPKERKIIPTGIKAYMQNDEFLAIYIRSSLGIKYGLKLANGVGIIDADYYNNQGNDGHIQIAIENTTDQEYIIEKGDKIAQGIFQKYYLVDDDEVKSFRKGGFGSTGK